MEVRWWFSAAATGTKTIRQPKGPEKNLTGGSRSLWGNCRLHKHYLETVMWLLPVQSQHARSMYVMDATNVCAI